MSKKLLKKLKDKEEKLIDAIYEIQELLDSTEDPELSSMGDSFSEAIQSFINDNDTTTLESIKEYIENELDG
jgi:predicted transcriptional regulator